jgi:hypothetical protein
MYNYSDKDREKDKLYHSNRIQTFPSEKCGKTIGLNSIYKDWVLPDGETAESLILKLFDGPYKIYQNLLKLNPELEELKISDELKNYYLKDFSFGGIGKDIYYHVCYGVISKFTIKDIKYFLLRSCLNNNQVIEIRNSRQKWCDVLEKHNLSIGWAACEETLIEISKHLGEEFQKYYENAIKVNENG